MHQQLRQQILLYIKLSPALFPIRDSIVAGIDTKAGIRQDGRWVTRDQKCNAAWLLSLQLAIHFNAMSNLADIRSIRYYQDVLLLSLTWFLASIFHCVNTTRLNSKTWQPVSVFTALDQGYCFDSWLVLFSPSYNGATVTRQLVELQHSYTELPNSETNDVPGQWYNPQFRPPRPWLTHISGGCARYGVMVELWLTVEIRRNYKKTLPNVTFPNTNVTSVKTQEADIPR